MDLTTGHQEEAPHLADRGHRRLPCHPGFTEAAGKMGKHGTKLPFRFQYMSDLHLERINYDFHINPVAPVLILAGNIGNLRDEVFYGAFLAKVCRRFELVVLVPGISEFYGITKAEGLEIAVVLARDSRMEGKLNFLYRGDVYWEDTNVTIFGCMLHPQMASSSDASIAGFKGIKEWTIEDHNSQCEFDEVWLRSSLEQLYKEDKSRKVVIVSHHAPTPVKTIHPLHHAGAPKLTVVSNVLERMSRWTGAHLVSHWVFGNTQWNAYFWQGKLLVQSNQLCHDSSDLKWWQKKLTYRPFFGDATLSV